MTTSPVVTTGEQVAETLHRLGYLIGEHDLPAPTELRVRRLYIHVDLHGPHDLNRWAEVTDATVTGDAYIHVACTVLGDVPLRMTAFGEALTP
jgi:hypothetical protein